MAAAPKIVPAALRVNFLKTEPPRHPVRRLRARPEAAARWRTRQRGPKLRLHFARQQRLRACVAPSPVAQPVRTIPIEAVDQLSQPTRA